MKIFFTVLFVLFGFSVLAQTSAGFTPKILLLDTGMNLAPVFNAEVIKYAPGYRLLGSETEPGSRVVFTYTDGRDGTIRIEYKYANENGRHTIIYQAITADLEIIMPIYNGLFHANIITDIDHASMLGGPIQYHHKDYQCLMQADDYKPGYWVLSFVE
jgi:hypothetical protein